MLVPDPVEFVNERGDVVLTLSGALTLNELLNLGVVEIRAQNSPYADGVWIVTSSSEPPATRR